MTDIFTASNGAEVYKREDGSIYILGNPKGSPDHGNALWPGNEVALAEYFQAQRDKELGVWRWPENPEYVVKPANDYELAIYHEPTFWNRDVVHFADTRAVADFMHEEPGKHLKPWRKAARAYLREHPIKRCWHDAKRGEVWLLEIEGKRQPAIVMYTMYGMRFQTEEFEHPLDYWYITNAQRIWPEEGDNDA